MTNAAIAPNVDTAKVRRVLKKAGLSAPKRAHSANIKGGFSWIESTGVAVTRQTEYKRIEDRAEKLGYRKAHVPTGRIIVSVEVANTTVADSLRARREQEADEMFAATRQALIDAGYTLTYEHRRIIVSA